MVLLQSYTKPDINYSKKKGGAPLCGALARTMSVDELILPAVCLLVVVSLSSPSSGWNMYCVCVCVWKL